MTVRSWLDVPKAHHCGREKVAEPEAGSDQALGSHTPVELSSHCARGLLPPAGAQKTTCDPLAVSSHTHGRWTASA